MSSVFGKFHPDYQNRFDFIEENVKFGTVSSFAESKFSNKFFLKVNDPLTYENKEIFIFFHILKFYVKKGKKMAFFHFLKFDH